MTCAEFEARLQAYVDGELSVELTADGDAHGAECPRCAALAHRERAYHLLLRRQARETVPAALRDRIDADIRRERQRARRSPWRRLPLPTAAAAMVFAVAMTFASWRSSPPLVATLVDKHIAYAQLDRPAELTLHEPTEIAEWFRQKAGLRVVVPDYSAAGVRLVGARLADAHERGAAYLLYAKGHVLMSVFMVPRPEVGAALGGTQVAYRGHAYRRYEQQGYHTVFWTDGAASTGSSRCWTTRRCSNAHRLRPERTRT